MTSAGVVYQDPASAHGQDLRIPAYIQTIRDRNQPFRPLFSEKPRTKNVNTACSERSTEVINGCFMCLTLM